MAAPQILPSSYIAMYYIAKGISLSSVAAACTCYTRHAIVAIAIHVSDVIVIVTFNNLWANQNVPERPEYHLKWVKT